MENLRQRAINELKRIEEQEADWNVGFIREIQVWEYIAMQINSASGKDHDFWLLVMDIHNEGRDKYKNLKTKQK